MSALSRRFPISLRDLFLAAIAIPVATAGLWLRYCHGQDSIAISASEIAGLEARGDFGSKLALAAIDCTKTAVRYDPAYVAIPYPGGDVPGDTGVCSDVVIRAFRGVGVDLQKRVHEDMKTHFSRYPALWGLRRPDPNIDHRRVPNLQTFFSRHGKSLEVTDAVAGYLPGDVIAWDLTGKGLWHIGLVISGDGAFVHNIGGGQVLDRGLFQWKVIGHYRFAP
jgi:uncharacterized protein YijF (DUF1287 family)